MAYLCEICDQEIEAFFSSFRHHPFVDGYMHEVICHGCGSVPKCITINGQLKSAGTYLCPLQLNSVTEMLDDGWNKAEATIHIKAVKKAISKGRPKVWTEAIKTPEKEPRKQREPELATSSTKIEPPTLELHHCSKCGKVCNSSSGLTLHLKSCNGDRKAEPELDCPWCHKSCSSTSGLSLHKKTCKKRPT